MSQGELQRVEVLTRVKRGQLRVVVAVPLLRVSYRQAKRLWKRYRKEGAAGLKHRSSNRAYPVKFSAFGKKDISNGVRKETFLNWFDTYRSLTLTPHQGGCYAPNFLLACELLT
jgi:hypothetical protein